MVGLVLGDGSGWLKEEFDAFGVRLVSGAADLMRPADCVAVRTQIEAIREATGRSSDPFTYFIRLDRWPTWSVLSNNAGTGFDTVTVSGFEFWPPDEILDLPSKSPRGCREICACESTHLVLPEVISDDLTGHGVQLPLLLSSDGTQVVDVDGDPHLSARLEKPGVGAPDAK